jgi:hypothetical protein
MLCIAAQHPEQIVNASITENLGHRYEALQAAEKYRLHPELLIDDMYRLDNAWAGVMPQQPWSQTYERGFFASNFGPGSVMSREGLGLGISGSNAALYVSLASGVKAGLELVPGVGIATNILSGLADLDQRKRAEWGNHILADDPEKGYEVALSLSQLRSVMSDMALTYPEASVRAGATRFIEEQLEELRNRGITTADKASKEALAASAPTEELKSKVQEAAIDEGGNERDDDSFEAALQELAAQIVRDREAMNSALAPLLDQAAEQRKANDWGAYQEAMNQAKGWASVMGSMISATGDPTGGARFSQCAQAAIELSTSISRLSRDFQANGEINAVALASGVGAAFVLFQALQSQGGNNPEAYISSILTQVLEKLDQIASELHQIHVLIGDLFSFTQSLRSSLISAISSLRDDLASFTALYTSIERQRLYSAIAATTAAAQVEAASYEAIERDLVEIATLAIVDGSQPVHTHGPGLPYSNQYREAVNTIVGAAHAEAFYGVLADALRDLKSRFNWLNCNWTGIPPSMDIPNQERFDQLLTNGQVVAPRALALALTSFRDVLGAHPDHAPHNAVAGITSVSRYHALIRASIWMNGLGVAAKTEELINAAVFSIHIQFCELVSTLQACHKAYLTSRGPEGSKVPSDILFGQWPYPTNDWTIWTFRTLQTLYRMGYLTNLAIGGDFQESRLEGKWFVNDGQQRAIGAISVIRAPDEYGPNWYERVFKEISDDQSVHAELERRCRPNATFERVLWYEFSNGAIVEYLNWKQTNPAGLLANSIAPKSGQIEERAKTWARESVASASNIPHLSSNLKAQIGALKRTCIQTLVLLKNAYPGFSRASLPASLRSIIEAAEDDFFLFEDVTRCFYGSNLIGLFIFAKPNATLRLPPGEIVVREFFSITELTADASVKWDDVDAAQVRFKALEAAMAEAGLTDCATGVSLVRNAGAPLNKSAWRALGDLRAATCAGDLAKEISYQLSRSLLQ